MAVDERRWRTTPALSILLRVTICLAILGAGYAGLRFLAAQFKAPPVAKPAERPIRVNVAEAQREDVQIVLESYGEVQVLDEVEVAPEVSGKVVEVHPQLEIGETIPKDEVLFRIDPRDYEAQLAETEARVRQLEQTVRRLKKQAALDSERLKILKQSETLAKQEFDRARQLNERELIGSESAADAAEIAYNSARDATSVLQQSIELYPVRIEEAEAELASARASAERATADLERTSVRTAFDARVKDANLEVGQYVTPGTSSITLADDSILTIPVPLSGRLARQWLDFQEAGDNGGARAWFDRLKLRPVEVQWTEDPSQTWTGHLIRVLRFDAATRQLGVLVGLRAGDAALGEGSGQPLVEGMFCKVLIPGKTAEDVIRLPAASVGFTADGNNSRAVFVARRDPETKQYRLETRPVEVVYTRGQTVYVSTGLKEGELVIVTRLINPIENSLLEIQNQSATSQGS